MAGTIDILACHTGHTTVKFDKDDPIELDRARRMIKQLIRMGCVLFIESGDTQIRVTDFDESCDCYIVADVPELEGLGDAVIPIEGAAVRQQRESGQESHAAAGEVSTGASDVALSGQLADSRQDSSDGQNMAPAANGEGDGGSGKRRGGRRRKVDASKVNTTVVPIQSGG